MRRRTPAERDESPDGAYGTDAVVGPTAVSLPASEMGSLPCQPRSPPIPTSGRGRSKLDGVHRA